MLKDKCGRPVGTIQVAGSGVSSGRPTGTSKDAGSSVNSGQAMRRVAVCLFCRCNSQRSLALSPSGQPLDIGTGKEARIYFGLLRQQVLWSICVSVLQLCSLSLEK